jgi:PIN domain nuclease of toxin-antitoxin system
LPKSFLTGFHRDPADQIIAATSRILGLPLLTADRKMRDFSGIETIW